ncbi:hypothetical protein ACX80E_00005, partial [Arthrobacter sp. TMN-49]
GLAVTTGAATTKPNNQFNINKLVSIKLGTLLSSQTTTTPSQHTQTNKQSAMISAEATFQSYPHEFQ